MRRYLDRMKMDRHLIGYSSGNFGKNLLLGSVDVTLLFVLTDLLGIAPQRVSVLMLMVFGADLMLDLGAGLLAAWAQNRGTGYRRLIVLGAPPCGIAFALIYSLPLLGVGKLATIAPAIIFFRGAYAIIDVPHNSLLARVATDSRARGRASGYRTVFSSAASVVIATVLVPFMGADGPSASAGQLALLGAAGGLLFCCAMFFAAWSAREEGAGGAAATPRRAARIVFLPRMDRLFGAIAVIALVTGFAMPVFGKMMLYIATYALHQPGLAGRLLLTITLGQLAGVALWIYLVRSHEKTDLLAASHAVGIAGLVCFAVAGDRVCLLTASAALIGVGFAGVFMLPWGILADITDFAAFRHRERRETATFATVLVILKAGGVASLAAIGWILGKLGYVPGVAQAESVIEGMKLLAFGVPILGSVIAILTLRRLALGHQVHARVVRANRRWA